MRRGIFIGVVGLLALVITSSAAAATAHRGPGTEVQRPNTSALVVLGESGGFELAISMPNPRVAVLYAFKFGEGGGRERGLESYAQSAYAVRVPSDALERGLIRARFPSLGKVSLRFQPSGKRRVPRAQNNCSGKRRVTEYGMFRGTISLEGEAGYFKVEAGARRGSLERSFRLVCRKGDARQDDRGLSLSDYVAPAFEFGYSSGRGTIALLYAFADEGNRQIGLRVGHQEGAPPGAGLQAGVLERLPGMPIGRFAFVDSDVPGTFTTSMPGVHPAFATLAPPPPFYGQGNFFENSATSHSWTGTLGVSLPGLDLPLTGEEFKTSLCVVSPLKTPAGCDFIKPKPVRGARVAVPFSWRQP